MWYSKEYNPIQVGSIDGTDIDPHDHAIVRASLSSYTPAKHLKTDPNCTLFVSRLNFDTTESTLREFFIKYGEISSIELVRNNVTGLSQGYAFITFTDTKSTQEAYRDAHERTLDDHVILVDYERSRVMKGWIPRRFGGGFGGKKGSGQLRFGARDRPFKRPPADSDIHVDYEERRSNCWRKQEDDDSKRSSRSSSRKREDTTRRHHSSRSPTRESSRRHGRSTSRDRKHHKSNSRSRRDYRSSETDDKHHRSTSKRHLRSRSREDRYRHHKSRSNDRYHHSSSSSNRYHESDRHHHYSDDKRKRYHQKSDSRDEYSTKRSRRDDDIRYRR